MCKMAWRNVWRNPRRSIVTIAAITIALTVTINYSGLIQGYLHSMERNILDYAVGDIQVFAPGYRDRPSIYTRIESHDELLGKMEKAGLAACARLLAPGLAAAGETSAGVRLIGVEIQRDARVSLIHTQMARGVWLDAKEPKGVVLGRRLATTLGVAPGEELVVLAQAMDGSPANDLYTVRGVLKGVTEVVDRTGVFMNADEFREFMVMTGGAHQLIVRRPAGLELSAAHASVQDLAGELEVKTWRELHPTLASMLDSAQGLMYAMMFIVYVAIGFLILNAMLMAVFERVREFGVLKALGVGPGSVFGLILVESGIKTGIAIVAGLLLSLPLVRYLAEEGIDLGLSSGTAIMGMAWDPILHAVVNARTFVGPIVLLVVVVGLAILYPALKAALIRPIRAMHHR